MNCTRFLPASLVVALLGGGAFGSTVREAPTVLPLPGFVENRGQWPAEVRFFAKGGAIEATVVDDGLVLRPRFDPEAREWPAPIVLRFPRAGAVKGDGVLPTRHHFLRGPVSSARNVRGFQRVLLRGVAPGIDVVVRKGPAGFAYDLLVAPGATLEGFTVEVEGAEQLARRGDDVLEMTTSAGVVEQRIGASWQVDAASGKAVPVASRFRVLEAANGKLRFGFAAPGRDPERAFVLDPTLVWVTYIGGPNQELLKDMEVRPDGAVYLTCRGQPGAPTTPGSLQHQPGDVFDIWIGKLSADATQLAWATFLGGTDVEEPFGLDVDQDGSVIVAGHTWSADFPTTPGSLQPTFAGVATKSDLFVSRLAADGASLVWSTFYGGPDYENASCSALFPSATC